MGATGGATKGVEFEGATRAPHGSEKISAAAMGLPLVGRASSATVTSGGVTSTSHTACPAAALPRASATEYVQVCTPSPRPKRVTVTVPSSAGEALHAPDSVPFTSAQEALHPGHWRAVTLE